MAEVAAHCSADSAWFVVDGRVYDATSYLRTHPGGVESIMLVAGTDATAEFNAAHSAKAKTQLAAFYIGELVSPAGELQMANGRAASSFDDCLPC